jgi:tetratricopeptide (TPR) repeat protein
MDLHPPSEIERLYGPLALEEWRLVLRQFELGEGFAFIVLTVPDETAAHNCRSDLQTFLAATDRTLICVCPAGPEELALLATTLLALPDDRAVGAIWVEAISSQHAADYPEWEAAWGRALGSLNQQRNLFRRRPVPLLLVGAPWLAPMVRQRAPDLWSVRALVARIDPVRFYRPFAATLGGGPRMSRGDTGPVPDVGLGQRAVERLRGVAGSKRVLADALVRTARGLDARGDWPSATASWQEAVTAYRAALEENPRDRVPLAWAATQNNLGNALLTLGFRESGTELLEQAVAAFRAALEENTRDRVPLDWATTQYNLGTALLTLGQRESGTERLEQAVAAVRAALEERTRDRVPLDWAMTQHNLGSALQVLGFRERGTERLEQAVIAYRAALEETTRDRVPLNWAASQHGLASTLATLAERTHDRARMTEAIASLRDVAEIYRQSNNTHWLPIAEQAVAAMQAALAKMAP